MLFRRGLLFLLLAGFFWTSFAQGPGFPKPASPPRLVNDFAKLMSPSEQADLEAQLLEFARTTSNEITIVTITDLNGYDIAAYATQLGNEWGVGKKGKENGVVILVAKNDRKMNISPGYGLEGALTDAMAGRIIRNEMAPEFRKNNYYAGLLKASEAIIAATQGEYSADADDGAGKAPLGAVVFIILLVLLLMFFSRRGGGGPGGRRRASYFRDSGVDFLTGALLGSMLGGGGRGGGGGFGGSGGGGFGGFGGGSFGGGGASGSW